MTNRFFERSRQLNIRHVTPCPKCFCREKYMERNPPGHEHYATEYCANCGRFKKWSRVFSYEEWKAEHPDVARPKNIR